MAKAKLGEPNPPDTYPFRNNEAMILRNHGLLAVGGTCVNVLFRLERACQVQVMALSCNTKLIYPPKEILEDTYERMQPKPGRGARNGDLAWPASCASSTGPIRPTGTALRRSSDTASARSLGGACPLFVRTSCR